MACWNVIVMVLTNIKNNRKETTLVVTLMCSSHISFVSSLLMSCKLSLNHWQYPCLTNKLDLHFKVLPGSWSVTLTITQIIAPQYLLIVKSLEMYLRWLRSACLSSLSSMLWPLLFRTWSQSWRWLAQFSKVPTFYRKATWRRCRGRRKNFASFLMWSLTFGWV